MRRPRPWILIGLVAGVLTAVLIGVSAVAPSSWGNSDVVAVIGIPFSLGLILASLPFGGLHNAPPVVPLTVLASGINGVFWGGLLWLESRRRVQQ